MDKLVFEAIKKAAMIGVAFVSVALVPYRNALSTANPVQSLDLATLDQMLSARSLNGLVTVIASWCPPCRKELTDLAKLYRKYNGKGIRIIAVSIDADGPSSVQPLVNELEISFPVYWVGSKAVLHYKIVGIPTLMVIREGAIIEKFPGRIGRSALERKIENLIP